MCWQALANLFHILFFCHQLQNARNSSCKSLSKGLETEPQPSHSLILVNSAFGIPLNRNLKLQNKVTVFWQDENPLSALVWVNRLTELCLGEILYRLSPLGSGIHCYIWSCGCLFCFGVCLSVSCQYCHLIWALHASELMFITCQNLELQIFLVNTH